MEGTHSKDGFLFNSLNLAMVSTETDLSAKRPSMPPKDVIDAEPPVGDPTQPSSHLRQQVTLFPPRADIEAGWRSPQLLPT